jgi:hypothetical protein
MTLSLNLKALGGFVPIYNTQASWSSEGYSPTLHSQ